MVYHSEVPTGAATAPGENPRVGPSEDMVDENSEVKGSLHGSVTGEGVDAISDQQLTPPPSPPPTARRVRITERTPSRFFIPQPLGSAGFSPARERSVTLQRAVRRLGTQLEGFKINTDLERHQRAAKRRRDNTRSRRSFELLKFREIPCKVKRIDLSG